MSTLTYLFSAYIKEAVTRVEGRTLTRPALIFTDGIEVTYAVDVDVGMEGVINDNGDVGLLPLRNVAIAAGNNSLVYAEIGAAVELSRSSTGQWQVTGFSKTFPNTYTIVPVTLPQYCLTVPIENPIGDPVFHTPIVGTPISIAEDFRLLTYEELSIYGSYGSIPYGAVGVFVGGVFRDWRI